MGGVVQSGVVLDARVPATTGREEIAVMRTLRRLTGRRLPDRPRAWLKWYAAQRARSARD